MSNYNSALQSNNIDLQVILNSINSLPEASTGVELPTLTNEGSAADLLSGKQLIDGDGNVVTGTITTKTASNLTVSGATVTVPAGYYASQATKAVVTATQATPSISVNSSGLITASATQTAGYISAGTKSSTHQLAFQAAKTITPSTASQIAVSSGYYTGGNITVKGDSNLVAGNIKSGVDIFGVTGTYEGSGSSSGGDTSVEDSFVTRTIITYTNDRVTTIGSYAFYRCSSLTTVSFPAATTIGSNAFNSCPHLTTVSFPAATTIGSYAFGDCSSLTTVSFPAATTIGSNAFYRCSSLTTVSFPAATTIGSNAFNRCSSLTTVSFPAATTIGSYAFSSCSHLTTVSFPAATTIGSNAFNRCSSLTTVSFPAATTIGGNAFGSCSSLTTFILAGSSVPTLSNSNAFSDTSMSTTGYFYVPSSLIASYQAATNWTYFSSRFSAVEDYAGWDGVYGSGT